MILVFDLDDTLFDEMDYVRSGFCQVAVYLSPKINISKQDIYSDLLDILKENGRGYVFDIYLKSLNLFSKKEVKKILRVYRSHKPNIQLEKSIENLLLRLSDLAPLYLVTDGNSIVQNNKIESLGLKRFFKKTFATSSYGINSAKPSLNCFSRIKSMENLTAWSDLVYIGDNPKKDFVNLKKVGAVTIRIHRGPYAELVVPGRFDAEHHLRSLKDLPQLLIKVMPNPKTLR